MMKIGTLLLLLYVIFLSCNNEEKKQKVSFVPNITEAKGYLVPKDSMAKPVIIPIDESKLKKIPVGKPTVFPTNLNVHPVGEPKVVLVGKPKIIVPGTDTFSLPKIVPAIDSPFIVGIPEVVIAKDPYVKDQNPESFSSFSKLQGLKHDVILCMFQDKSGNLWFGTNGGGVSKYDGKSFTHFTEKEGLSSNYVSSILEDKSGNLWFGSRFGLSKLYPENKEKLVFFSDNLKASKEAEGKIFFKNYTYEDGFLGFGVNGGKTICEDKNGTIWVASNDRLTAFHPEGEFADTVAPNIQLTSIALFNENIAWINLEKKKDSTFTLGNGVSVSNFEFDGITKWYNLPENLSLAYNNNYLTFSFIGITQKQSKKVKYQYKLEGIDENWSAITNRTEASYGNLPHGKYIFKVKAMNSEGYWSEEFNYTFTIRPPWWKTWWAYSIYGILIITSVILIVWWNGKKLRERANELKIKVEEATYEIKAQKLLIEEKHKEITDSINYAERIRRSLLASKKLLDANFNEYFILFKPKDVVSGDFYWATKLSNNNFVLVVADSTRHGVPGAIMSIVNIACLKEATLQGITSPDLLLNETRRLVIENLKNDGSAEGGKDGMDGSLLSFDFTNNVLQCALANNPVWIVRGNEFIEIKGDRFPIGKHDKDKEPFTLHTLSLHKGDVVYTLTDGIADQFGGVKGKKFKYKNLQKLLLSIAHEPMETQKQKLNDVLRIGKECWNKWTMSV